MKSVTKIVGSELVLTVTKFKHPSRLQTVVVVPVPRVAQERFYQDFCYQPFAKDYIVHISLDIFLPWRVPFLRLLFDFGYFPGYRHYSPVKMSDSVDNDLTRYAFMSRERGIYTSAGLLIFTIASFRDVFRPGLARRVRNIVGKRYLTHPPATERAHMLLLPPSYAEAAIVALEDLGFRPVEQVETNAGDNSTITRCNMIAEISNLLLLLYIVLVSYVFWDYIIDWLKLQAEQIKQREAEMFAALANTSISNK